MTDRFGLSSRQVWTQLGVLLGIIAAIAIAGLLSSTEHWDIVELMLLFVAGYIVAGALLRPWWFWDRGKGALLRNTLGDRGASIAYLLMGLAFAGLGAYRGVGLHEARVACREALRRASPTDSRAHVVAVLASRPVPLQGPVRCSELLSGESVLR